MLSDLHSFLEDDNSGFKLKQLQSPFESELLSLQQKMRRPSDPKTFDGLQAQEQGFKSAIYIVKKVWSIQHNTRG